MKHSKFFNLKSFNIIEILFLMIFLACAGFVFLMGSGMGGSIKDGYSKAAATMHQTEPKSTEYSDDKDKNSASIKDSYDKARAIMNGSTTDTAGK